MITPVKIFSISNRYFRILYHYRHEKIVHHRYNEDWIVRYDRTIGVGFNHEFRWFHYKKLGEGGIFYRQITICGLAFYVGHFTRAGAA